MSLERGYRVAQRRCGSSALKSAVAGTVLLRVIRLKAEFFGKRQLFLAYIDNADAGCTGTTCPLCGDESYGTGSPDYAEVAKLNTEAAYRGASDRTRLAKGGAGVAEIVGSDDKVALVNGYVFGKAAVAA